jgi:hypothetical protein
VNPEQFFFWAYDPELGWAHRPGQTGVFEFGTGPVEVRIIFPTRKLRVDAVTVGSFKISSRNTLARSRTRPEATAVFGLGFAIGFTPPNDPPISRRGTDGGGGGIVGISARSCIIEEKTGYPSANRDRVRGEPTGHPMRSAHRREEQPDEKGTRLDWMFTASRVRS